MATLERLQEQRAELEARLDAGDTAAEAALARLDAAIQARTLKIQGSQKRLAAVKHAVSKGVSVAEAKAVTQSSGRQKKLSSAARKPINRFE